MKKIILTLIGILALVYGILFTVFFFDLDGKALYYIVEPFMVKRFDNMKRKDATQMPYDMKEPIRPVVD